MSAEVQRPTGDEVVNNEQVPTRRTESSSLVEEDTYFYFYFVLF